MYNQRLCCSKTKDTLKKSSDRLKGWQWRVLQVTGRPKGLAGSTVHCMIIVNHRVHFTYSYNCTLLLTTPHNIVTKAAQCLQEQQQNYNKHLTTSNNRQGARATKRRGSCTTPQTIGNNKCNKTITSTANYLPPIRGQSLWCTRGNLLLFYMIYGKLIYFNSMSKI